MLALETLSLYPLPGETVQASMYDPCRFHSWRVAKATVVEGLVCLYPRTMLTLLPKNQMFTSLSLGTANVNSLWMADTISTTSRPA